MKDNYSQKVYEALLFCVNYDINEMATYCKQQMYIKQLESVHWSQIVRLKELIKEGYDINNPKDKAKIEYFLQIINLKKSYKIDTFKSGKCKIINFPSQKKPN